MTTPVELPLFCILGFNEDSNIARTKNCGRFAWCRAPLRSAARKEDSHSLEGDMISNFRTVLDETYVYVTVVRKSEVEFNTKLTYFRGTLPVAPQSTCKSYYQHGPNVLQISNLAAFPNLDLPPCNFNGWFRVHSGHCIVNANACKLRYRSTSYAIRARDGWCGFIGAHAWAHV